MPKRGRKKLLDPPTVWKVSLPSSVAISVELLLCDPLTGKPKHGARSKLLTQLMRKWLSEHSVRSLEAPEQDAGTDENNT